MSLSWASKGLNELPKESFEFPFILIGKLTVDFFSKPIMAGTQILVHRWRAQNKDFGAVSQRDLTRV